MVYLWQSPKYKASTAPSTSQNVLQISPQLSWLGHKSLRIANQHSSGCGDCGHKSMQAGCGQFSTSNSTLGAMSRISNIDQVTRISDDVARLHIGTCDKH